MKLIKAIDKVESASPVQVKYAYLFSVDDIKRWFYPERRGIQILYSPEIAENTYLYQLYITPGSQDFSFETVGERDSGGFKVKFSGTHPGCFFSSLEFAKKFLHERFIIMIPQCDGPTIILGTPDNPMVFSSSHKSEKNSKKFIFNFEQEIDSEEPYLLGNFKPWDKSRFLFFDRTFDKSFN